MAFKVVAIAALLAVANAGTVPGLDNYAEKFGHAYVAPDIKTVVAAPIPAELHTDQNTLTGDHEGNMESSSGDEFTGEFILIETNRNGQNVDYTHSLFNGFNPVPYGQPEFIEAYVAAPIDALFARPNAAPAFRSMVQGQDPYIRVYQMFSNGTYKIHYQPS